MKRPTFCDACKFWCGAGCECTWRQRLAQAGWMAWSTRWFWVLFVLAMTGQSWLFWPVLWWRLFLCH